MQFKRFLSHLILTLSWCLRYKIRSRWEKFAPSYNLLFRVTQITSNVILHTKIINTVNIAQKQVDLLEATNDDEELKMLKQVIINGWSEDVKHIPKPIKSYWSLKESLSVQDGLVT